MARAAGILPIGFLIAGAENWSCQAAGDTFRLGKLDLSSRRPTRRSSRGRCGSPRPHVPLKDRGRLVSDHVLQRGLRRIAGTEPQTWETSRGRG